MFNFKEQFSQAPKFEYFDSPAERHDIYEFSKELADHLHEKGIKNIVFMDRSARLAWVGLDEYWKQNYPNEKHPGYYFINPDGFFAPKLVMEENKISRKDQMFDAMVYERTGRSAIGELIAEKIVQLGEDFGEKFKNIDIDEKLAIFDTCSHTGHTLLPVVATLDQAGYDLEIITARTSDDDSEVQSDKSLDANAKLASCYPFGRASGIAKGSDMVSSRDLRADRDDVVRARKEIREIIKNPQ